MGYTHYWRRKKPFKRASWTKITIDSEKLINAYGRHKLTDVLINEWCVFFNGECETFDLSRGRGSEFCKTNGRPYDRVICAILSVASEHAPGLRVGSDGWMGDPRDRWPEAAAWATRILKRPVRPPVTYLRMPIMQRLRVLKIRFGFGG
jgi:hypothetical protein